MTVILLDSGTRKARKTHQCFHCYRPIPRGEEYSFSTCKHDHVYTLAMHTDCLKASDFFLGTTFNAHSFNLDDGYPPLMDMVWDNDGQHDIDALRGHFPHVACRLEFHAQKRAIQ
jgi:hypothetical protein